MSAAADIRAGTLKVLLPDCVMSEPGGDAILHANRYIMSRVRVLLDFLIDRFSRAADDSWDGLSRLPEDGDAWAVSARSTK